MKKSIPHNLVSSVAGTSTAIGNSAHRQNTPPYLSDLEIVTIINLSHWRSIALRQTICVHTNIIKSKNLNEMRQLNYGARIRNGISVGQCIGQQHAIARPSDATVQSETRTCPLSHLKYIYLIAFLLFNAAITNAAEITKTFHAADIPEAWQLSKGEGPEEIVAWSTPEEKGIPIISSTVEYYPWITSVAEFGNVSKVEVEVYTDYSKMHIPEIKVGETELDPAEEYGYDTNPEKTFVFVTYEEIKPLGKISIGFFGIADILYLKSITVTYDTDGIDREMKWSVSTLDVNLGESFENPTLSGETSGVRFESSCPEVATVDAEGIITPLSEGQTIITAICPKDYPWSAAECSYTLNVNFTLTGTGTSECVVLTKAGTLKETVMDLESIKIRSIKVTGPINSTDISYLRETTGRFSNLQEIDLTDATLDVDNSAYATLQGASHGVGLGYTQYVFVLSNDVHIEEASTPTGLGGGVHTVTYYGNQLEGAFSGLSNLKRVMLPSSLTSVAPFLACGCSKLVKITLPEGYTEVGESAFYGCSALAQVQNSTACVRVAEESFKNSSIVAFDFSNVQFVDKSAFANTKLSGLLSLPNVETIGERAFYDCAGINSVVFGNRLKVVGDQAMCRTGLSGKLTLPTGCEQIGGGAFTDCEISEIEIPASCLNIGAYPFERTPWWENALSATKADEVIYLNHIALAFKTAYHTDDWTMTLEFREGTTTIADRFGNYLNSYGYDKITAIKLPSSLRWIGDMAFKTVLSKTEEIKFPDVLEHIGYDAFHLSGIGSVSLGSNISYIGDYAFSACDGLVKVYYDVPNATGLWIFSGCKGLERVTFGPSVRSIPEYAFYNCSALVKYEFEQLTLPQVNKSISSRANGAEGFTIGEGAFKGSALSSAVLPPDITSVGENAFEEVGLKTVYCFAPSPIDISSSGIFSNGKSTTIYVPKKNEAAFKADPYWSKCNIVGADMGASIETLSADTFDANSTVEVFNLKGVKIFEGAFSVLDLPQGIYIIKTGSTAFRIISTCTIEKDKF